MLLGWKSCPDTPRVWATHGCCTLVPWGEATTGSWGPLVPPPQHFGDTLAPFHSQFWETPWPHIEAVALLGASVVLLFPCCSPPPPASSFEAGSTSWGAAVARGTDFVPHCSIPPF